MTLFCTHIHDYVRFKQFSLWPLFLRCCLILLLCMMCIWILCKRHSIKQKAINVCLTDFIVLLLKNYYNYAISIYFAFVIEFRPTNFVIVPMENASIYHTKNIRMHQEKKTNKKKQTKVGEKRQNEIENNTGKECVWISHGVCVNSMAFL